ncbi:MAG TPA: glycosyltransferase family 2 protein [Bryobacteraceae bacterium]|nr:glycosyltransferase family 2 protein [Bryobacteraceae bacterium]
MRRLAIVIPTWNRAGLLGQALENLKRQTYPIDRVIVVDNGSTDNSAAVAAAAGAEVISLPANAGFAAAVNRGIREAAGSEWIGVLNNDVTLAPDWLAQMIAKLEQAWFATGKVLDAKVPERMDGSFDAICRGACAWRCGHGRPDSPMWNQPRNIQLAPFTAAVFRTALFQRVGFLDERFESYLEDVEFGLRCAEAGLGGVYVPEAVAHHQGSATLGRWHPDTVRNIARNQLLLVAKHYPPNWILRYGWPVFIAQILWGFVALRHGALLSYFAGKAEGLRQFRKTRGEHCARNLPAGAFSAILAQSEKEIREIQKLTGFDLYWRLYFALT